MPGTRPSLKVGVLLSGREQFSPYYGGALARWTFEVYSRLRHHIDVTVFGYPTAPDQIYNLRHRTSSIWHMCNLISQIPGARRYEEPLWLRALMQPLRQLDIVHIHNRPQWVTELRNLGYPGKIWLHLQNNHLGHWTSPMLNALAPQLDGVAVCSTFLRDTFAPKSPSIAAKTKVIFNGVNTQLFHPNEALREPKTIFFVGRFDQEKGVLELVRAFEQLLPRHPDAKLGRDGNRTLGSLYDLIPPGPGKHPNAIGEWNTARIAVKGGHVEHWLNGAKVLEFERGTPEFRARVAASKFSVIPDFGSWAEGHILLQNHGGEVSFRNLKIRTPSTNRTVRSDKATREARRESTEPPTR